MKNKIVELLPALLLAAFGGFAGTLANRKEGEHLTMKKLITELVIAVFSGLLTYYLLQEYGVSENLRTAAVALAGYSARGVLARQCNLAARAETLQALDRTGSRSTCHILRRLSGADPPQLLRAG